MQATKRLKGVMHTQGNYLARIHNKIVVHMFDTLDFDVIGQNYHKIEKQPNWVAVYDLKKKRNFDEMYALAAQLYPGFSKN